MKIDRIGDGMASLLKPRFALLSFLKTAIVNQTITVSMIPLSTVRLGHVCFAQQS